MTLVYLDPQSPLPDRVYQGRVQLVEVTYIHTHMLVLLSLWGPSNNVIVNTAN